MSDLPRNAENQAAFAALNQPDVKQAAPSGPALTPDQQANVDLAFQRMTQGRSREGFKVLDTEFSYKDTWEQTAHDAIFTEVDPATGQKVDRYRGVRGAEKEKDRYEALKKDVSTQIEYIDKGFDGLSDDANGTVAEKQTLLRDQARSFIEGSQEFKNAIPDSLRVGGVATGQIEDSVVDAILKDPRLGHVVAGRLNETFKPENVQRILDADTALATADQVLRDKESALSAATAAKTDAERKRANALTIEAEFSDPAISETFTSGTVGDPDYFTATGSRQDVLDQLVANATANPTHDLNKYRQQETKLEHLLSSGVEDTDPQIQSVRREMDRLKKTSAGKDRIEKYDELRQIDAGNKRRVAQAKEAATQATEAEVAAQNERNQARRERDSKLSSREQQSAGFRKDAGNAVKDAISVQSKERLNNIRSGFKEDLTAARDDLSESGKKAWNSVMDTSVMRVKDGKPYVDPERARENMGHLITGGPEGLVVETIRQYESDMQAKIRSIDSSYNPTGTPPTTNADALELHNQLTEHSTSFKTLLQDSAWVEQQGKTLAEMALYNSAVTGVKLTESQLAAIVGTTWGQDALKGLENRLKAFHDPQGELKKLGAMERGFWESGEAGGYLKKYGLSSILMLVLLGLAGTQILKSGDSH